jgi:hypothetical protein
MFIDQELGCSEVQAVFRAVVEECSQLVLQWYEGLRPKMVPTLVLDGLWRTYIEHKPHRNALAALVLNHWARFYHFQPVLTHIVHKRYRRYGNGRKQPHCQVKP